MMSKMNGRLSPWIGIAGLAVTLISTTVLTSPGMAVGQIPSRSAQVDAKIAAFCAAQAQGHPDDAKEIYNDCIATSVGQPEVTVDTGTTSGANGTNGGSSGSGSGGSTSGGSSGGSTSGGSSGGSTSGGSSGGSSSGGSNGHSNHSGGGDNTNPGGHGNSNGFGNPGNNHGKP